MGVGEGRGRERVAGGRRPRWGADLRLRARALARPAPGAGGGREQEASRQGSSGQRPALAAPCFDPARVRGGPQAQAAERRTRSALGFTV